MGLFFRKSFGKSPFRVNLSKSGIGISTGVKGARLSFGPRGAFIHLGRKGIYYRQKLGRIPRSGATQAASQHLQLPASVQTSPGQNPIPNALAQDIVDSTSAKLISDINDCMSKPKFAWIVVILTLAATITASTIHFAVALIVAIVFVPIYVIVRQGDIDRRTHLIQYSFDVQEQFNWDNLVLRLSELVSCTKIWRIESTGPASWKNYGGAKQTVIPVQCEMRRGDVEGIETNVSPYVLKAGNMTIVFLPDKLLLLQCGRYGALDYGSVSTVLGTVRFVEETFVPNDTQVVGSTWRFVNQNGSPDRRYSNNRELPICLYQTIALQSPHGLNLHLMASSVRFKGL